MECFKYLVYFVLFGYLIDAECIESSSIHPIIRSIFLRRKRTLLGPKGSSMKFTVNVSKKLIALYPRGLNFVLEAAAYYPMPTTTEEILPKRLRKPSTKPPASKNAQKVLVCVPGTAICYKSKKVSKTSHITKSVGSNFIHNGQFSYTMPHNLYQSGWRNNTEQSEWLLQKLRNNKWNGISPYYSNQQLKYRKQWSEKNPRSRAKNRISSEWNKKTKYFIQYRERRNLFDTFVSLGQSFSLDMQSCIMRMICDSKKFLLPKGYSMIQDILRLIFSFKSVDAMTDDYNEMMRYDYKTCDHIISYKCPFSFLDWFLKPNKW